MFNLSYKKNNNSQLFKCLEENGFSQTQNYVPLYQKFFSINDNNYNNINLNHKFKLCNIKKSNNNIFESIICDDKIKKKTNCFFKCSPLIDPTKYMIGKYKNVSKEKVFNLPKFSDNNCQSRLLEPNNVAYIDSFFCYLSSMVYHHHNIHHCVDFFGSFLCIKKNFKINIADDIDYLYDSTFYHKNKNNLFDVDEIDDNLFCSDNTRNFRKKLIFNGEIKEELKIDEPLNYKGVFKELTEKNIIQHNNITSKNLIFESPKKNNDIIEDTNSHCSSRTSHTSNNDEDYEIEDEENESDYSSYTSDSLTSDIELNATFNKFPVQIICLEKLENTLDNLMEINDLSNAEWKSCLFQIIMNLVIYQKMFDFTHNDLHTNNVMYKKTEKQFIWYKLNGIYYKVPTYGRLFKIIDFGRAIYKFRGVNICSDSYSSNGDASSQYNCEPFFNKNKPKLEPNKSFDLCRLACSLFDFFIEDIEDIDTIKCPIKDIINEWCKDDNGRNILYKKNGEERYPEFKLYKMIARTVHNHIPEEQIKKPLFNIFKTSGKNLKKSWKSKNLVNIDTLPCYILKNVTEKCN